MSALANAAARLARSAVAQGFELKVTDPSVLGRIAGIIAENDIERGRTSPRARHRRKEVKADVATIEPTLRRA